ncbi:MAG TPA: 30S ribosomal protein S16 [Acidimicrobiales bacterium]|nr:30S ribosomal protein S16 [Acidimicrobiales bacterium]
MAVKLRLVRMGKKKQPTYRVVAADSRSPRDGRFLEIVGTYAPRGRSTTDRDAVVTIDNAKAVKWLSNGAKPTERVERLLRVSGAWDEFTGSPSPAPAASPAPTADEQSAPVEDAAPSAESGEGSPEAAAGDAGDGEGGEAGR